MKYFGPTEISTNNAGHFGEETRFEMLLNSKVVGARHSSTLRALVTTGTVTEPRLETRLEAVFWNAIMGVFGTNP